jgi:sterol 3beta-glucosyltransferase
MTDAGHNSWPHCECVPDISRPSSSRYSSTKAFSAVALPDLPLGGGYRWATHVLNTAMFRFGSRLLYRRLRASVPGLPRLTGWPFAAGAGHRTPVLFAYSPRILPRPPDWPTHAHVTGYWQLPPPAGWAPQKALVEFLESGPPPVYFGPGSMRSDRLLNSLRRGRRRGAWQRVL